MMKPMRSVALAAIVVLASLAGAAGARATGATITVTTLSDVSGGSGCTLRDAITAANSDAASGGCSAGNGADTIVFGVSGRIALAADLPTVTSTVTIDGSGQAVVLDGAETASVLEVRKGATLTVKGLTIENGGQGITTPRGSGGAILNHGRLTVRATTFSGNGLEGQFDGGAIYNDGDATVESSTFEDNAGDDGGAISNVEGTLSVRSSSFSDNQAETGGGIYSDGALSIDHSSFRGNSVGFGAGGAIGQGTYGPYESPDATLTIRNSSFSENGGGEDLGGAVDNGTGSVAVSNSTFTKNAGGIAGSELTVTGSTFDGNDDGSDGGAGAVLASGPGNTIRNSTFSGNVGTTGAIRNLGTLSVTGSTFVGNSSIDDGGFGGDDGGPGGAIDNGYARLDLAGTLTVVNSTFVGNSTASSPAGRGGAIANESGGSVAVTNSTLVANHAYSGGGLDNGSGGRSTVANTIVAGNSSADGTGNCSGGLAPASTHNLADDATCGTGFTQVKSARLKLGPLASNGGPTQTIALGHGSVAIDAGDNAAAAGLATDQRGTGYARIVKRTVDVGAFELQK